jgi:hypothetical protein
MQPCSLRYGLWLLGIKCLNVIGYLSGAIMWPSKTKMRKNLHAFYNAGICSQHDIMYISYNILLCLPCRGLDLHHAAGRGMLSKVTLLGHHFVSTDLLACFRRLVKLLGSGARRITTLRISIGSASSSARGLGANNYSCGSYDSPSS